MNEKDPTDAFADQLAFEKTHRRPDGLFSYPVSGFGPPGGPHYTLWLISPKIGATTVAFEDGEPTHKTEPTAITQEPALITLRNALLRALSTDRLRQIVIVEPDLAILRYASVVLRRSYQFDDAELTMLLSGREWMEPMIQHALGGEDLVRQLAETGRVLPEVEQLAVSVAAGTDDFSAPAEPAAPMPPAQGGWLGRVRTFFQG